MIFSDLCEQDYHLEIFNRPYTEKSNFQLFSNPYISPQCEIKRGLRKVVIGSVEQSEKT